jgi:hypothetical protein
VRNFVKSEQSCGKSPLIITLPPRPLGALAETITYISTEIAKSMYPGSYSSYGYIKIGVRYLFFDLEVLAAAIQGL